MLRRVFAVMFASVLTAPVMGQSAGHDWPQWQGPQRDNRSAETGLAKSWPKRGPKRLWSVNDLGEGTGAPSISEGRVFGLGWVGGDEIVWARSSAGGERLWNVSIGRPVRESDAAQGPRGTPTVDGSHLYALGASGDLVCLRVKDGALVWRKNLVTEFGGVVPRSKDYSGYAESPLVYDDWVIVTPGGTRNTIVALNKLTGKLAWRTPIPESFPGGSRAAFSSIVPGDFTGSMDFVQVLPGGVVGVSERGELAWRWTRPVSDGNHAASALVARNTVFASAGPGRGSGLARIELSPEGGTITGEMYYHKALQNSHGGVVLVDEILYGSAPGMLVCLDFRTGKLRWKDTTPGSGSIIAADGKLYYRSDDGTMYLLRSNPVHFEELGRFVPVAYRPGKLPAPPAISHGKLYLRDHETLSVYDVRGNEP
jgi:outer membrane protein assembly factor BamB